MIAIDLSGRRALVTGASGGIGAAVAAELRRAGASVVAHYRSDPAGAALAGDRAEWADLREAGFAGALLDRCGPLDVIVHNAADQRLSSLRDSDPDFWRDLWRVNVEAIGELTAAAAARWVAEGRPGTIVAISSIEARQPAPDHGVYGVTKAALEQFVRAAAAEYGPHGIRVNAVAPGLVQRPGLREAWPEGVRRWETAAPLSRLGDPADVAHAVAFLASDLAAWVTGSTLVVDGGILCRPTW